MKAVDLDMHLTKGKTMHDPRDADIEPLRIQGHDAIGTGMLVTSGVGGKEFGVERSDEVQLPFCQ